MSKKARRRRERRERLALVVSGAHASTTKPTEVSPAPQESQELQESQEPRESYVRDAVTGERLTRAQLAASLVFVVRDRDVRVDRDLRDDYPVGVSTPPATLHTREQEGAVGKRYSAPFARYLAPVLPTVVADERRAWHQWWTVPYVVERLRAHMEPERFAVAMARLASHLPLADVERGGFEYRAVVAEQRISYPLRRHSREWVLWCERDALKLVRSHYLPRRSERSRDARRVTCGE